MFRKEEVREGGESYRLPMATGNSLAAQRSSISVESVKSTGITGSTSNRDDIASEFWLPVGYWLPVRRV